MMVKIAKIIENSFYPKIDHSHSAICGTKRLQVLGRYKVRNDKFINTLIVHIPEADLSSLSISKF